MNQGQPSQAQPPSQQNLQQSVQLQVHGLNQQQQQQSPTKLVQQAPIGKSPPHHPGLQQVSTGVIGQLGSGLGKPAGIVPVCSRKYQQMYPIKLHLV